MKRIIESCLQGGARSAQLFSLETRSDAFSWSAGRLEKISSESITGHNLTVNGDGRQISLVFTGTGEGVASRAHELLPHAGKAEYDFPSSLEPAEVEGVDERLWEVDKAEVMAMGERLMTKAQAFDPAASVGGGVGRSRETRRIVNGHGLEVETRRDYFSIGVSLSTARAGDIVQVGASRSVNRLADLEEEILDELRLEWDRGSEVVELEPGIMPVLLLPSAVAQLSFALDGLKGSSFYMGTSPFVDRLGEAIVDERISLVDDALLADGRLSHAFDDEGVAGQRNVLVDRGVLKKPILNLRSASKLDMAPTGNGLRNKHIFNEKDFSLGPGETWTNLVMSTGEASLEELLSEMKEGFAISSMFGLIMGNTLVGEVNTSVDTGYRIRDGKFCGRVKGRAIGSNVYDLLGKHLQAMENRLHVEAAVAGSFHVPHVLLKDVNIA